MNSKQYTKISDYDTMSDALNKLMVNIRSVGETQGPGGRLFFIEQSFGTPRMTKDGYTVIESMNCKEELMKPLLKFIQSIVSKTNDEAGDGTTYCATVMAEAFLGLNKLRISGTNILDIQAGYDFIVPKIHEMLDKISKKIDINSQEIEQVAKISANGDIEVGKTIAEAIRLVGKNGVITVTESKSSEPLCLKYNQGMNIDRSFISPYFMTNTEKGICEMENVCILYIDKKISQIKSIINLLESASSKGKSLLIVAEDIEGEALSTLIINKLRGTIKVCAIKAPGFGERRSEILKDMAALTGGSVICEDYVSQKLEEVDVNSDSIGHAKKVLITKESTTIIVSDDQTSSEAVQCRINMLSKQIEDSSSEYDKEKLQERLAKLSGGVAVIHVGGQTEAQQKELKDRVDDALNATKAAVAEGVVPGAGVAQLSIAYVLHDLIRDSKSLSHDAKLVANKILDAFSCSVHRIIDNTGRSAKVVINKLHEYFEDNNLSKDNFKIDRVYNSLTHEYVNPFEAGIIDPKKVIKIAFTNAINAIYMLLKCEGAVYFEKEEKCDTPQIPGGMGGMEGMY